MGSDMFLGFNNWFKRVILIFPFLLISNSAFSEGTYWRINAWYNEYSKGENRGNFDFSKCGDFSIPVNVQYGDSGAPRDDVIQDTTENYIMFVYGKRWDKSKRDGIWKFAQGVEFKAPSQFKGPIVSALKKALSQGNCQAASDLANGLANGQSCKGKDGGDAYCFARENADGSKNACLVESDGSSFCKVKKGQIEETNPDGTPKINIDCPAGKDCREETDLNGYANQPDKKDDDKDKGNGGINEHRGKGGQSDSDEGGEGKHSKGDKSESGGSGSDGPDKRGSTSDKTGKVGAGKADNGKSPNTQTEKDSDKNGGQDNGKTDKTDDSNVKSSDKSGKGKGANGDGKGSGGGGGATAGNGKGDGEGDGIGGDGKDDKDKEAVDFSEAPSIDEAFAPLKKALKDKFSPKVDLGGGDCPKPQFSLMGKTFVISAHCDILAQLREQFATLMMFLYTFAAIRIVLSA